MTRKSNNHHSRSQRQHKVSSPKQFKVAIPLRFLITSLLSFCLLAFGVGRATRHLLLETQTQCQPHIPSTATFPKNGIISANVSRSLDSPQSASSSSSWRLHERDMITLIAEEYKEPKDMEYNGNEEVEEKAVARHLMLDINNVDEAFLNSERRLANSMLEVVNEAKLTLLSYYCQGLVPFGVSCIGILKQNYVALHTWPERGVITLDLCVGGTWSVLKVLPIMERLFAVPRTSPDLFGQPPKKPSVKWAHKFRGFNVQESSKDFNVYVLRRIGSDVKNVVSGISIVYSEYASSLASHVLA